MRAAPPAVEIVLGSGMGERGVVALLHAGAAVAVAAWLASHGVLLLDGPLAVAAIGAAAGGLGAWVWRPAVGRVRWDGEAWSHLANTAGHAPRPLRDVRLQVDLSWWMLVRLTRGDGGGGGWFAVSRRQAGPAWHAARLALYHTHAARAPDDGAPS